MPEKKYVVTLTVAEREQLHALVSEGFGFVTTERRNVYQADRQSSRSTLYKRPESSSSVNWQFDGDDIVYVLRTAYDGAANSHDANRITSHKISGFRTLLSTTQDGTKL